MITKLANYVITILKKGIYHKFTQARERASSWKIYNFMEASYAKTKL
ncbi:hypothetical protein TPHV1_90030 [Treponema phagedenis]|uniref:Uncharacterized protein n=1 Tax=Treponema phagedenis TaxID=162 RepID=A0A0B7H371_TREPH|nr:hypothetical protein TPHV1_90030 [Treponema phagedenis]